MPNISVIQFAKTLGTRTVLGLAQKAGLSLPPPAISVRALLRLLGLPLQPTGLRLFWDVDVAGQIVYHPPDDQTVPLGKTIQFDWSDPADSPVRKATDWQVEIKVATTGQDFAGSPFSSSPGHTGISDFQPSTRYSWNVVPINNVGQGPSSPTFTFQTSAASPPPAPPPPATKTLTLRVSINIPAQKQSITSAGWSISGPGAPQTPVGSQIQAGATSAEAAMSLPPPPQGQSSVMYTVRSTVAFHYESLTGPAGISGAEDTQVDLSQPANIPWTGQSRIALFSVYDSFNNIFVMTFDGLL